MSLLPNCIVYLRFPFAPRALRLLVRLLLRYDNYGGSGTADKAMSALRAGGVYLLLPHGDSAGTLSKHPKPGVR